MRTLLSRFIFVLGTVTYEIDPLGSMERYSSDPSTTFTIPTYSALLLYTNNLWRVHGQGEGPLHIFSDLMSF